MDYDWVYILLKSKGFVHVLWRLKPYQKPGRTWKDCVQAALSDRVCLTIVGHYDQSPLNYDPVNDTGDVFPGKNKTEHAVQSYAASLDCLDYKILGNANAKQCKDMLMLSNVKKC